MEIPFKVDEIFAVKEQNFNELALKIFRFQASNNAVYGKYLAHVGVEIDRITSVEDIPFLPVEFFKTHEVLLDHLHAAEDRCFKSSSTTGLGQSCHYFHNSIWYDTSIALGFNCFYGDSGKWEILTTLPGYNENPYSSLIYMAEHLGVKHSDNFLENFQSLMNRLKQAPSNGKLRMVIGVSHALLDFAMEYPGDYSEVVFVETGGMKGRRREITRNELHQILTSGFEVKHVHSEYGMSELFSQAYSDGGGLYRCPPWMKVLTREMDDPFKLCKIGITGGVNVIDLANIESCCFIATSDIGKRHPNGTFEILGRFDHSEVRGCNVLVS